MNRNRVSGLRRRLGERLRAWKLAHSIVLLLAFASSSWSARAGEKVPVLTALGSMQRTFQHQKPLGATEVSIAAARNEYESFQIVIAAPEESSEIINAELMPLAASDGARIPRENVTLYREEYVRVRQSSPHAALPPGLYPDPLIPFVNPITGERLGPSKAVPGEPSGEIGGRLHALPFFVFKGQNQPLWIDVYVPKTAAPGTYRAKFVVTTRERVTAELPVTLNVWNFTLPDGPTLQTRFWGFERIAKYFDAPPGSDRFNEIERRFCTELSRHRINPPIPVSLIPQVNSDGTLTIIPERHEALSRFLAECHVTNFMVPVPSVLQGTRPTAKGLTPDMTARLLTYYKSFYRYLKENGWLERAYLYLWDEPNSREEYESVRTLGATCHREMPGLKICTTEQPFPQDPSWPDIGDATDIWTSLWSHIHSESIARRIAEGDEVWSYTALAQRAPSYHPGYAAVKDCDPPYWHIDQPLLAYRIPPWINKQYGITGLAYWSTLAEVEASWYCPVYRDRFNGEGVLFYPGNPCRMEGPVPSLRIKNLRDGMEDYEYLVLLERQGKRAEMRDVLNAIAPSWWGYAKDPETLLAARRQLAERIQGR